MKRLLPLLFLSLALLLQPLQAVAAGTATMSFNAASAVITPGQEATLILSLNTQGEQTTGADAVFQFDPTIISIKSIIFNSPNLYGYNFYSVNNNQIKITSSFTDVASSFSGQGTYVLVTVIGKNIGSTSFSWVCTDGQTNDTNIVKKLTGEDIVNCAGLQTPQITVQAATSNPASPAGGPTPTPTAQPQPTADRPLAETACAKPDQPGIISAKPSAAGEINITWYKGQNAKYYSIFYGTAKNNYVYGAGNIGDTDQFLIRGLKAGTLYYVALQSQNDCGASNLSETSSYAGGTTGTGVKPIIVTGAKTTANLIAKPATQQLGQAPTTGLTPLPTYYPRSDESLFASAKPSSSPVAFETDKGTKTGFPWWLLIVGAIILFLVIFFFIARRKKEENSTLPKPEIYKPQ